MIIYEHIIIGGGCAGLQLANALLQNSATAHSSILVLEAGTKNPTKSWCFWAEDTPPYAEIIQNSWDKVAITADQQRMVQSIGPMKYHYISSDAFYAYHETLFSQRENVTTIVDEALDILESDDYLTVRCAQQTFLGKRVYDSRPRQHAEKTEELVQHFVGIFVRADTPCFREDEATLMDFDIEDASGSGFCYLLPFSATSALVEITFFTPQTFDAAYYHTQITAYLKSNFPGVQFEIDRDEVGHIGLAPAEAEVQNPKNVFDIGTRGGMTKPSTGYTFSRIAEDSLLLVEAGTNSKPGSPARRLSKPRFQFYDALLLSILKSKPDYLKYILVRFFKAQPYATVLNFLNEKTTLWQEINIFLRMPVLLFLRYLFKFLAQRFLANYEPSTGIKLLFFGLSALGCLAQLFAQKWLVANQLWLLFGIVFSTGLLHGSLDYYVEGRQSKHTGLLRFIATYLGQMALVGLVWMVWPLGALGIFLVGTAWHFGDTDVAIWKVRLPTGAAFLYGLSLVAWLFASHAQEVLFYLHDLGISAQFPIDARLLRSPFSVLSVIQFASMGSLLGLFLFTPLRQNLWISLQIVCISFLLWHLPLLIGFGLYFGIWHSLHTLHLIQRQLGTTRAGLIRLALPYLVLSVVGSFAMVYWLNAFGFNSVLVLFIFISTLTLPHSLVMHKLFARS